MAMPAIKPGIIFACAEMSEIVTQETAVNTAWITINIGIRNTSLLPSKIHFLILCRNYHHL